MIEKKYFVIVNGCELGEYYPLMDVATGMMAMFASEYDAMTAGENNEYGKRHGFEIFELGGGEAYWDGDGK